MELRKAVDNLLIYDPEFQKYADKFVGEMGGSSAIQAVGSMDDLKAAINSYTNVKFLEICLHGSPGNIHFSDKSAMVGKLLGTMIQNSLFLNKSARILFDNCNIGEGEAGDIFMDELGMKMLKGKGGMIGATTVKNEIYFYQSQFSTDAYMKPFSFGRLKVRRYDEDGNRIAERVVDRHGIQR